MTDDNEFPASGAVFTFGRSRFADNIPSHFFIRNDPIIDIDCGDEHTAVVCQNGRVFVFGNNEWGQLGLGHRSTVTKPSCIKSLKPDQATHVACGRAHTIISTGSGKVFACGNNSDGQLGVGDTTDRDVPTLVEGVTGTVEQLAAGCHHSAALNKRGEVFVWGSNSDGQLGLGKDLKVATSPTRLKIDKSIAKIACGYYHTVILSEEGELFVCGEGEGGKLGLGTTEPVFTPTQVTLEAWPIYIAAGGNHTFAVAVDGKVYGWGSNLCGQLGLSDNKQGEVLSPTLITLLEDKVVKEVACGDSHSAFITELGELLTCGETRHGKLGLETSGPEPNSCPQPVRVPRFKPFTVTKARCGGCHTMVLASPRTVDTDDHLSNGHVPANTLQPPEVDILSPPIGARGPLPPLQRVHHVNSTSVDGKLFREDSLSSNILAGDVDDTKSLAKTEPSVEIADLEGDEKADLEKENEIVIEPTPDTAPVHNTASEVQEEDHAIITLKHQDTYDSLRTQTQGVVETCETTIARAKSEIEKEVSSADNVVSEKIHALQKKSKMCILL